MADANIANVPEEDQILEQSTDIFDSDDNRQNLIDYLVKELNELDSDAGRKVRMERNKKIKRQRIGRPAQEEKSTPWEGASNVVPPMVLQKTNTVATKMMQTLMIKKPLFTYEADAPYEKHADALTKHIQKLIESPYGLDFYKQIWTIIYDACSMGTKFLKIPFKVERLKFNKKGADGGKEVVDRILKALPQVEPIPFEDFMTRPEWTDIQKAPWIAVRYYKYYHEILALQQQGYYSNVELIIDQDKPIDSHKQEDMTRMGLTPTGATEDQNRTYKIYEVNVFWDADGDGFAEDLKITIEPESQTILRAEYNDLGIRDYVRLPYIELPDNLYGLGVGEILMSLQDEVETLHNMRIDAQHLTLNPVQVISETAEISGSTKLRPGKVYKVGNPKEDFQWQMIPDLSAGALQSEQFTQMYADKATGASQAMSGGDVGGSNRIGATGTTTLLNQSLGFLDAIATQLSHRLPEIAMLILYQMVRHGELIQLDGMNESEKILLQDIYNMDVEDIPGTFKFRARLSAVQDSLAAKQQASMGLYQIYKDYTMTAGQMSTQLTQLQMASQQGQDTARLQEIMMSGLVGMTKLMENMLKNYDEDNTGDYLPFVRDMQILLQQQDEARQAEVENIEARDSGRTSEALDSPLSAAPPLSGGAGGVGGPSGTEQTGPVGANVGPGTGETIGGPQV
jgi:hypothetical protein